jgi:hypothetical protein
MKVIIRINMKNIKYSIFTLFIVIFAISILLVACSDPDEKNVNEVNNGSTILTQPVPTFSDAAYKLIPNPCTTITIESINELVSNSKNSGPLQQNTVGPNKTCEWKLEDENYPRL